MARSLSIVALLCASLVTGALAQQPPPPPGGPVVDVTPKLVQVALFKNGLAMLVTEVEVPPGAERLRVRPLPAPVHGTFWITTSTDQLTVPEVIAAREVVTDEVPALTVPEMLVANVGREVVLVVEGGEVKGTLVSVPQDEVLLDAPADRFAAPLGPRASVVVVRTADGVVTLERGAVRRVAFAGAELKTTWPRARTGASLLLRVKGAQPGATATISWLARGLAWAPTYRVDVSTPGEGVMSGATTIVNDLVDLEDVPVSLISGFPNLSFSGVTSPLGLSGGFDAFAQELAMAGREGASRRESVMTQQAIMSNFAPRHVEVDVGPAAGEAEDLYFHELGRLTLAKGQRASVSLFQTKTAYEHVHRWEVPDLLNEYDQYRSYRGQPEEREAPQEVWHMLRLTNPLAMPWTTAPILVARGPRPLGQDICSYTAPRGKVLVKITKALTVQADQREVETARKRDAERWAGNSYDRVDIRGELQLVNGKSEKITVEVTKELSGAGVKAEPAARLEVLARGLRRPNPTNRLTWTVTLEPGQEAKLAYEYQVLVRQ